MSEKGTYYQFNIDFKGSYIRGYMVSTAPQNGFFIINEPTFSNQALSSLLNSNNGTISLSQNIVVCYFEIKDN